MSAIVRISRGVQPGMKNNLRRNPSSLIGVSDWQFLSRRLGVWELFVGTAQNFLLPRFTEVAKGLFYLLFSESRFWEALYISNQALILGFVIS